MALFFPNFENIFPKVKKKHLKIVPIIKGNVAYKNLRKKNK